MGNPVTQAIVSYSDRLSPNTVCRVIRLFASNPSDPFRDLNTGLGKVSTGQGGRVIDTGTD